MKTSLLSNLALALALMAVGTCALSAQTGAVLSQEEESRVRETQDPGGRIVVYLDLLQDRLANFDAFRRRPVDPKYDQGGYLNDLMGEYIRLVEEMKNWIEYQYEHKGDMRDGLRALEERGSQQLTALRGIQDSPDPFAGEYRDSLRDALDQVADALEGGTKALADQQKQFKDMKQQVKEDKRLAKQRRKEEARRTKEEKELRKRQGKKGRAPGDLEEE